MHRLIRLQAHVEIMHGFDRSLEPHKLVPIFAGAVLMVKLAYLGSRFWETAHLEPNKLVSDF